MAYTCKLRGGGAAADHVGARYAVYVVRSLDASWHEVSCASCGIIPCFCLNNLVSVGLDPGLTTGTRYFCDGCQQAVTER
jgi:hypothetical protein